MTTALALRAAISCEPQIDDAAWPAVSTALAPTAVEPAKPSVEAPRPIALDQRRAGARAAQQTLRRRLFPAHRVSDPPNAPTALVQFLIGPPTGCVQTLLQTASFA